MSDAKGARDTDSGRNRAIAHGVGWMLLFKVAERSLGIVSTLVLVRLLAPDDFGMVAMAQSVIVMVQLLAAFGFDVALIRDRAATDEHYHTAWTLNVALGALISVIVLALAVPIAHFYGKPELVWVVCLLSLTSLFAGLENIGVVAFRKELRFRSEFVYQIGRKLVAIAVTLPLAWLLRSYWALVAGTLASAVATMVASYYAHPFRPRPTLAKARELLEFSRWLLVGNAVAFVRERSSDFFIGRLSGPAALGTYSISYEISNLPTTELSAPINRALMPGFSALAGDAAVLHRTYLQAFGLLMLLAVPAAVTVFVLADLIVPVLLGTRWLDAVPLIRVLAIAGIFQAMQSSCATALIATGHPKSVMATNALYACILLCLLGLLVPLYGALGAAAATVVSVLVATPVFLLNLRRYVGVPLAWLARQCWRPAVGALVIVAANAILVPAHTATSGTAQTIGWLGAGVVLALVSYATTVVVLWWFSGRPAGAEEVVLSQLRTRWTRQFSSA